MISRSAYLLTCDKKSYRTISSKKILEEIGFDVKMISCISNENKVLSNKLGMQIIYELIKKENEEYSYVFEDDINLVEKISIEEIAQYEEISKMFFYLGCCLCDGGVKNIGLKIYEHEVFAVSGGVRCLHAIGLSKMGAKELLNFSKKTNEIYMDIILEEFSKKYPANIVRFDLESPLNQGHRGIVFQDQKMFPSTIHSS